MREILWSLPHKFALSEFTWNRILETKWRRHALKIRLTHIVLDLKAHENKKTKNENTMEANAMKQLHTQQQQQQPSDIGAFFQTCKV